jgi:hypothetical protein
MRACAYFYMVRTWGPVIIIEDNQKMVDNPVLPLNREEQGMAKNKCHLVS